MMSLTKREIGHQNTQLDRGKGEIGDGSVSIIHIAREKTLPTPTEKKSTLHRDDGKGSSPRWCRRVRFVKCERVVGRQSDFGFPCILLKGGFSERENDFTGHNRRTSFSLSTASKAARPVLVDPGRPSPPREPPLVTLPLGWPNNRLNMMMMAKALFLGNFVRRFVPGVDTKKDGGGCPRKYIVEGRRRARGRRKRVGVRTCSSDGYDDE